MSNECIIHVSGSQLFNQVFNSVTQRPVWPIRGVDTPASDERFAIDADPTHENPSLGAISVHFEVPALYESATPREGRRSPDYWKLRYQSTQRSNTVSSYIKAASILQKELADKDQSQLILLDYGAGLCRGTKILEGMFPESIVVAYEPFPDKENSWFVNPADLFVYSPRVTVNATVCLNVLNVLDLTDRKTILEDIMNKSLGDPGLAIFGVRSRSDITPLIKKYGAYPSDPNCAVIPKRINELDVEVLQTGFTFEELKDEILEVADSRDCEVVVERIDNLCGVGALVKYLN